MGTLMKHLLHLRFGSLMSLVDDVWIATENKYVYTTTRRYEMTEQCSPAAIFSFSQILVA